VTIASNGHEHEFEPQHGLPERLPEGEQILWQGSPELRHILTRVFHLRLLAAYFAVMLAIRASNVLPGAGGVQEALSSMAGPVLLALLALAALAMLARLVCSTTVYTLTNQRVVMRIGIVLTLSYNLPLRTIASADLKRIDSNHGDIALALSGEDRIAWFHLWPHARPWRLARPEPMLRAVPDAARVAELLSSAWASANGVALQPATSPATQAPSAVSKPAHAPASSSAGASAGGLAPSLS